MDAVERARFLVIGTGATQAFEADTSFALRVTLRDGLGRTTQQLLEVETFEDRPPPLPANQFRAAVVMTAGARTGEVRLELVRSDRLRVEVLDVTGRARTVITDGPADPGTYVLRFEAATLEPGVYLMRVRHGSDGKVLRFAVVR